MSPKMSITWRPFVLYVQSSVKLLLWLLLLYPRVQHCYTSFKIFYLAAFYILQLLSHQSDHTGSSPPTAFSIGSLFQGPDPWQLKRTSSSAGAELFSACLVWGLTPPSLEFKISLCVCLGHRRGKALGWWGHKWVYTGKRGRHSDVQIYFIALLDMWPTTICINFLLHTYWFFFCSN